MRLDRLPKDPVHELIVQAHTVGDKIYLVGGLSGSGASLHHIDMYDPVLDLFEDGSRFSSQQFRMRYASGVLDNKIYVAGGLEEDPGPALVCFDSVLFVWVVQVRSFVWSAPSIWWSIDSAVLHSVLWTGSSIFVCELLFIGQECM